jgi:protein TonB
MFEDSTFASAGVIHTGSHKWMVATFAFNSTILLAMVLVPLLLPQALPRMVNPFLIAMPTLQLEQPKPVELPKDAIVVRTNTLVASFSAPTRIPDKIYIADRKEIGVPINVATMEAENGLSLPGMPEYHRPRVAVEAPAHPVRVSGLIVAGMLIRKTLPIYPPIAHAAHVEGTVVLAAIIARDGTIQNLHVVSGNGMLQQAALDAVRTWRYRPYLLNGEPVEVETTVNVIFKLG